MKRYDVIYADPPWPVRKVLRRSRPNQTKDLDYETMTLDEIKSLAVQNIAKENSVLFLWTTHAFLPDAFSVMAAWGFKYQRVVTWDKSNGMTLFGFHHRTEMLLFGYRGKLEMYPRRKAFPTMVSAKSAKHSQKPDIFRNLIEPFGSERIELFSRKKVDGWDCWGNEVDSDITLTNDHAAA